jgi:hypothetical protein
MPDLDLTQLGHALIEMRVGRGRHRHELRRRLALVDGRLREARNSERLKLAGLKARLNKSDTRLDNAILRRALERSTARLAELDRAIIQAISAQVPKRSP